MSCNKCPGSVLFSWNSILKEVFCKKNYMIATAIATGIYEYINNHNLRYEPFSLSSEISNYKMNIISTSIKMEGTSENDLMIAHLDGSKIFAKGGLNYIKLDKGADQLFYSLCSTDIVNNTVGVVENFEVGTDKIFFYCTKKTIFVNDITIRHDKFKGHDITYVEVQGEDKISAIALLGDISLMPEDIILNHKWETT